MTENQSLNFVRALDPRIDTRPQKTYVMHVGNSNVAMCPVTAETKDENNLRFVTKPPTATTYISRRMIVEYEIALDFEANPDAAGNFPNAVAGLDINTTVAGPRAYPLSSVTRNLSLRLCNDTVSIPLNDVIHPLMHFGSGASERGKYFGCPSKLDIFPTYPTSNAQDSFGLGPRAPFTMYQSDPIEVSRNAYLWCNYGRLNGAVDPAVGAADPDWGKRIILHAREPVFISPLDWGENQIEGLFGIDYIGVEYTINNLKHVWCSSNIGHGNPFNIPTKASFINATLWLQYIEPPVFPLHKMPSACILPYYELSVLPKDITPVLLRDNSKIVISSNIHDFPNIPSRIYIFCKAVSLTSENADAAIQTRENNAFNYSTPDVFAICEKLTLTWNGQPGLLSNHTAADLHLLAVNAGSDQTFIEFTHPRMSGSILCIRPGIDFRLKPAECNGSTGKYQFSCNFEGKTLQTDVSTAVNAVGHFLNPRSYKLFVVPVYEGTITIANYTTVRLTGLITESMVLSNNVVTIPPGIVGAHGYHGGSWKSFWGSFKDFANNIPRYANKASKFIKPFTSALSSSPNPFMGISTALNPVLDSVIASTGGRRRAKSRSRSKGRKGGRVMRRSSLKRRAY